MSDQHSNQPDFSALAVKKVGRKSYFTKIGVAFNHSKGDGLTIELSALPIGDQIVLFPPKDDAAEKAPSP